ncbi:polysaccharide deacetylase family protein [Paenibacillus sp. VCA1]|uniref:polysaccharide deacetylase family protein n=1 Tax=Paenibacillus sp. VCA1 TaxID=3039148 RepID=UPI002872A8CE|nr:polysaccharide deacetylase family protein [Paenibacillus sp. VCA1]MDR9853788.1 polysaccharide deacetylase family protein [Paenibacillus sp. VCA1]
MVRKTAALLLLTALLLSACGGNKEAATENAKPAVQQQEGGKQAPAGGKETNTNEKETTTAETGNDGTGKSDAENADPADGSSNGQDQPAADGDAAEVPIKYHMNKAYNIVPNDEGTEKNVVLLTFDDGPKKAEWINSLIDTLDKHHAKAIFFVNGYRVKEHPELLKLIHDRGQIIGNHSWDHISLRKEPEAKVRQQIEDVQAIVKDTIGEAPAFFRPPFGEGGDIGKKIAKENGLLYMTWSNGSLDWTMKSKGKDNPQKVIQNVMDQLHPGSNILMHELPWTTEALDQLLTKLESKGYSFVDPRSIELEMR